MTLIDPGQYHSTIILDRRANMTSQMPLCGRKHTGTPAQDTEMGTNDGIQNKADLSPIHMVIDDGCPTDLPYC